MLTAEEPFSKKGRRYSTKRYVDEVGIIEISDAA